MNKYNLSVAIPTYNSSKYLENLLSKLSKFKAVNEILIQDDNSSETEYEKILDIVNRFKNISINIIVKKNDKNIGAYLNKYESIKNCTNNYVYQIDSDNLPGKNLDKTALQICSSEEQNIIYYPSSLIQIIDGNVFEKLRYKYFKKNKVLLSSTNKDIDLLAIKKAIKGKIKITQDKNHRWILNCGNFIVNKSEFTKIIERSLSEHNDYFILDAVAFNYYWIKNGGKIKLLKDHFHYHRKREDSVSMVNANKTIESFNYFEKLILDL